jgi:hypothetical protein
MIVSMRAPAAGALALALVLSGCAARRTVPEVTEERETVCVAVGGEEAPWASRPEGVWWSEEGRYLAVERAAGPGPSAPSTTLRSLAEQGAADALRLLESRGVVFAPDRAREIAEAAADQLAEGGEPDFPRLRVADRLVEECRERPGGGMTWREAVLVEYPTPYLRGDLNNALFERERARNESSVALASAADYLAHGRWLDGLSELVRARSLVEREPLAAGGGTRVHEIASLISSVLSSVQAVPAGGTTVVEAGQRRRTTVEFRWSYEWDGSRVPAVGLPVTVETSGFAAIIDAEPVTDVDGIARADILVAYGATGAGTLASSIDTGVVGAATGDPEIAASMAAIGASAEVLIVHAGHAITVCLETVGLADADAAQLRAGFERRMERDGFRMAPCGPGAAVVVRIEATVSSEAGREAPVGHADAKVAAFDQRVARPIGDTTISIDESAGEGRRDAEVLALKEVGRLAAAYLTGRILASGD